MTIDSHLSRNPLARAATATPPWSGRLASTAGRALCAVCAVAIALDQPYTRTRVLTGAIALAVLASLLPFAGRWNARAAWLGAGIGFFGAALLAHLALGQLMLACAAVAAVGAALEDARHGRMIGASWFFAGCGVIVGLVTVLVLGIDG